MCVEVPELRSEDGGKYGLSEKTESAERPKAYAQSRSQSGPKDPNAETQR